MVPKKKFIFLEKNIFLFTFSLERTLHKKSGKKCPQKLLRNTIFFSVYCPELPKPQTEEFIFQNVVYIPTVYKTGALTMVQGREQSLSNYCNNFF